MAVPPRSRARLATTPASPATGRRGALQAFSGPRLATVSASPGKGLHGAVIEFSPVLDTPTTRATSPSMRFFHVLNLKMRVFPALTVSGLGVPTRKGGSMALYMCLNPAPPYGLDSQTVAFSLTTEPKP